MSGGNRKRYEVATVLDQDLLDDNQDNLVSDLRLVVDIETPSGFIRASDRNMYVGGTFYKAITNFPNIKRSLGTLLAPTLEFSTLELEVNNVDGALNNLLPSGNDFSGWINKQVDVRIGLRDVASTYKTIFRGFITEVGGFSRTTRSINIIARDQFDTVNVNFPNAVFTKTNFPDIQDSLVGVVVPIIYGDWTTNVEPNQASVPAFPVNGAKAAVKTTFTENVSLVISENDLVSFDTTEVYLVRGEVITKFDSADIVNVGAGNRSFEIRQSSTTPAGTTLVEGTDPFEFNESDSFFVKVVGKDLGAYDDNPVEQARDILKTFGGLSSGDFDSSWDTFRDKASPTVSAVSTVKSRVWIQEPQPVLDYALSLLEQVRLEAFVNRDLDWSISSLHFDEFVASPAFLVRNWDVERASLTPGIDVENNFNRAQAAFNFLPNRNESFQRTPVFRNQAAITQIDGKEVSKLIEFPNLYIETDVENNLKEIIKLASSYFEIIDVTVTWRSLLLDIGDFVKLDVKIGSTEFDNVPCLIREIGYDPNGVKLPMKVWNFQMVPFGSYAPGYSGTVGGESATITEE